MTDRLEARVLAWTTNHKPADGSTHWSSRKLAAELGDLSHMTSKEMHVIADNLSAHKTTRVHAFLTEPSNVHLHFTPTYSSWLNQVELWFAKIERDVIARGVLRRCQT